MKTKVYVLSSVLRTARIEKKDTIWCTVLARWANTVRIATGGRML